MNDNSSCVCVGKEYPRQLYNLKHFALYAAVELAPNPNPNPNPMSNEKRETRSEKREKRERYFDRALHQASKLEQAALLSDRETRVAVQQQDDSHCCQAAKDLLDRFWIRIQCT